MAQKQLVPIQLPADPTNPLEAATKQYVDRWHPRVFTTASTNTLTPEIDTYDLFSLTAQAAALTISNHSTSTPTDGEMIRIRILDNGTARGISYGTNYVARGGIALPSTTVLSKFTELGFEWFGALTKYVLVALAQET